MERRLLLDVVVLESPAVLELLAREDEALLVGGDPLFVLDLSLDVVDRVRGLHLEGDGLARDCGASDGGIGFDVSENYASNCGEREIWRGDFDRRRVYAMRDRGVINGVKRGNVRVLTKICMVYRDGNGELCASKSVDEENEDGAGL